MAVGVNNDATGNAVARKKSSEIELDMQAGYFDSTLLKYKPKILGKTATEITAPELFAKFTQNQAKEKNLANRSIEARYTPILRYLERSLNVPLHQVTERLAGDFAALQLENVTQKKDCGCLKAVGIGLRVNIMSLRRTLGQITSSGLNQVHRQRGLNHLVRLKSWLY